MIHVACAADALYIPHAAAMMRSLVCRNDPAGVVFHFLHEPNLDHALLSQLARYVERLGAGFRAHSVSSDPCAGLPVMGRISRVMWLRVFLPELLAEIPRVLYVDCDTLVMDELGDIWRSDLEGAWVGAVSNVFESSRKTHASDIGLEGYFNSGVLLLDLDAWRREHCGERVLALARDPGANLLWPDQDALNRVLAGHWKPLHPRWNCQNSVFYFPQARTVFGRAAVEEAIRAPGILHFEGGALSKPWHYLCRHPWRGEYFRHRANTPWPDVTIEGRTAINRVLRVLPTPLLIPAFIGVQRLRQIGRQLLAVSS